MKGLATDEIINQRIQTETSTEVTLLDLCIMRRYKSGLNFLVNICKISVNDNKL